jgi:hypothetical protein
LSNLRLNCCLVTSTSELELDEDETDLDLLQPTPPVPAFLAFFTIGADFLEIICAHSLAVCLVLAMISLLIITKIKDITISIKTSDHF